MSQKSSVPQAISFVSQVLKRDTLAAAKARGVKLGRPKLAQARKVALEVLVQRRTIRQPTCCPIIREIRKAGATTLPEIADALNARGVATARGSHWDASTVSNVLAKCVNRPAPPTSK